MYIRYHEFQIEKRKIENEKKKQQHYLGILLLCVLFFLASVFLLLPLLLLELSRPHSCTQINITRAVSLHLYASFTLRLVVLFQPNTQNYHTQPTAAHTHTHSGDIQCYSMHYILKATHHFKHLVFSAFHLLALAHYYYYYDCFVRFSESCLVCVKSARERGRLKTRSNSTLS